MLYWGYIRIMKQKMETTRVRANRSPCCFLYVKVARNVGLSAIGRINWVVGPSGNYCSQDKISLFVTLYFGF